ncbi:hypothetical protein [Blattabacterium cuenoti]|uniref:hypothetical protein n=1 Tax=Blattabacterium cuenoti TaxID=1653831 RepID=UPI00163CCC1F|nr:hypothetical protein [Blattabacterium cuenoti]
MDCRRLFFLIISFLLLNSCYKPLYSKLNEYKKKIQINEFVELVKLPFHGAGSYISYDIKRMFENYIIDHGPFNLAFKEGGDIVIGGKIVDYSIIEGDGKNQKIKIIVQAYCKDIRNSKNNWKEDFEIIENFHEEKDALNEGPIRNKIVVNLVDQLYKKTIEVMDINSKENDDGEKVNLYDDDKNEDDNENEMEYFEL